MRAFSRIAALLTIAVLSASCGSSSSDEGGAPLAAPTNLAVTYLQDPTSWHYTFTFNAVESAESYLVYYSSTNDHATAQSLAAGQFAPLSYTYLKTTAYGGGTYFFWVRAYDGRRYGAWSASISGILN